MGRVPGWKPQTEEEFRASLKNTFGDKVTDDNIHEYIKAYNTAVDQVIQGPGVNVMGVNSCHFHFDPVSCVLITAACS